MAFERTDTNTIVTLHSSGEELSVAAGEVVDVGPLDGPLHCPPYQLDRVTSHHLICNDGAEMFQGSENGRTQIKTQSKGKRFRANTQFLSDVSKVQRCPFLLWGCLQLCELM